MEKTNSTDNLEKTILSVTTFAEFALEQIKTRKPEIDTKTEEYWTSDCLRLKESIEKTNQENTYENATRLSNLACGLMKIYEVVH